MWRLIAAGVVALAVTAGQVARGAAPAASTRPGLVVILVVDQMRADYVERFAGQWTQGLHRLVTEGGWFRGAAYPYLNTVTCAGHATIATGTVPANHGLILNEWWDRDTQHPVTCTNDPASPHVSYGGLLKGGQSAARLVVPTLADEMRRQLRPSPRIVTLSIKARSAIMAGRSGDAVTWFEEGTWTTSKAYAAAPVPAVDEWVRQHPFEADRRAVWDRALPRARYLFEDSPLGKKPPRGWGPSLPHALDVETETSAAAYRTRWLASPYADEYVGSFAAHLIDRFNLGRGPSTDFLGVSFSAVDAIGHKFGPASHEVQDALVRLDATIGRLLAHLDLRVGKGRYVLAFSSDHGVSEVPEQVQARGEDAGRVRSAAVVEHVERALDGVFGPGEYVARMFHTDFYFRPGVYGRLQRDPRAMAAAMSAIQQTPGIARVYRSEHVARREPRGEPFLDAARLSYRAGRSGDLIIVPKPNWIISADAATHGTAHPYDRNVPIVLFGHGISSGRFEAAATPADIAPTLAHVARIKLPHATGRVLTEALARSVGAGPAPAPEVGAAFRRPIRARSER
jgi:predicted AlkP superfamily pyrophosphatase or phosphodiesterase